MLVMRPALGLEVEYATWMDGALAPNKHWISKLRMHNRRFDSTTKGTTAGTGDCWNGCTTATPTHRASLIPPPVGTPAIARKSPAKQTLQSRPDAQRADMLHCSSSSANNLENSVHNKKRASGCIHRSIYWAFPLLRNGDQFAMAFPNNLWSSLPMPSGRTICTPDMNKIGVCMYRCLHCAHSQPVNLRATPRM